MWSVLPIGQKSIKSINLVPNLPSVGKIPPKFTISWDDWQTCLLLLEVTWSQMSSATSTVSPTTSAVPVRNSSNTASASGGPFVSGPPMRTLAKTIQLEVLFLSILSRSCIVGQRYTASRTASRQCRDGESA